MTSPMTVNKCDRQNSHKCWNWGVGGEPHADIPNKGGSGGPQCLITADKGGDVGQQIADTN